MGSSFGGVRPVATGTGTLNAGRCWQLAGLRVPVGAGGGLWEDGVGTCRSAVAQRAASVPAGNRTSSSTAMRPPAPRSTPTPPPEQQHNPPMPAISLPRRLPASFVLSLYPALALAAVYGISAFTCSSVEYITQTTPLPRASVPPLFPRAEVRPLSARGRKLATTQPVRPFTTGCLSPRAPSPRVKSITALKRYTTEREFQPQPLPSTAQPYRPTVIAFRHTSLPALIPPTSFIETLRLISHSVLISGQSDIIRMTGLQLAKTGNRIL